MILLLQRLRRDEEGQALVLGAIFGLVLMLCVLSTVNLGRAVYGKVQLQTAADAAAYSQAAVEARVLNFTAYTNRAMVVHYASIMAAAAYLSWVHFLWAAIDPALSVLRNVPYAGPVFGAFAPHPAGVTSNRRPSTSIPLAGGVAPAVTKGTVTVW